MEETKVSKREWVKTAAIIFLAILLVLTFFSNTIMNATLPEVAAQQIEGGTINAKIRGSGTVGANETYDVTINQTRKIASVLVKVGQSVNAGDTLFLLEAQESDEVKAAQDELDQLELSYEKSLIDAGCRRPGTPITRPLRCTINIVPWMLLSLQQKKQRPNSNSLCCNRPVKLHRSSMMHELRKRVILKIKRLS